ncbi:MarR family transcriptional regulator [Actinoallomurus sp. NPDC052274]|uniref:MarR family winged helix-turn-helix transcriptional regulator n=1 Tax=Actinoallomurus sp. NPDC052274 TaxID=3155420 RepID=UPI003430967D
MERPDRVDAMLAAWRAEDPGVATLTLELTKRVGRLAALCAEAAQRALEEFGVTYAEFDVLATLRRSGRPYRLKPGTLAESSMLTTGGTSNILQRLGAAGLVRREPDPDDRRSTWVCLTPEGLELTNRIVAATGREHEALFGGVTEETGRALADLLREVLLTLGDEAPRRR